MSKNEALPSIFLDISKTEGGIFIATILMAVVDLFSHPEIYHFMQTKQTLSLDLLFFYPIFAKKISQAQHENIVHYYATIFTWHSLISVTIFG